MFIDSCYFVSEILRTLELTYGSGADEDFPRMQEVTDVIQISDAIISVYIAIS